MVRETRHLWVGNLPENIREDRIREHFKRYGRVQSVKLLPRGEECPVDGGSLVEGNEGGSGTGGGGGGGGSSTSAGGASATVAFMDIKSAAKAHATEHTLDERALTTQYYEPQHLQHRFPSHGSSEDHGSSGGGAGGVGGERGESFESRGSHGSFYGGDSRSNRVGGVSGGGSSVVVGHQVDPTSVDPGGYIPRGRPPPSSSYHVTSTRARDRLYPRTGPYSSGPPPPPHLDRHRSTLQTSSWSNYESASSRYGSGPPPPSPATTDSYPDEPGNGIGGNSGSGLKQHKKQRRKSRSGSSSPSGSSRSGSSSSSRSGSSGGSSSGGSSSPGSSPHRTGNASVTEDRRPLAICVRNLPARSSDTSLKDGLFHEYKKHGKVTWVKVVGAAGDRYALVCFKKPEDVEKALEVSHDKLFFGCKIEVAPYQGYDVEDNEFRPYEAELDEYHPKATRTLFIGSLEKDVTASELRKHFEPFGEIIEIDIKKQGAVTSYAFCQYTDISSVVKAMRSMDGEHLGSNRIKLGFGKSMPTSCVWVDGIGECVSEKYINMQFHQFGPITQVVVDRERGHALVFFEQISCAQAAVKEMRGAALRGRRLQVDFASRECQETFYEHLERQGFAGEKPWDTRPSPAATFDVTRERTFESAVTVPNAGSRFTRYETPPRARAASYSRTPGGGSTPGASPAHPTAMSRTSRRSYQDPYYESDYSEPTSRRFRSYDEFSQGSGASHDDYDGAVIGESKLNDEDCPTLSRRHTIQSVVTSVDSPAPPPPLLPPPDIRHLQKERVHLLEQLEECHSSGDEVAFTPKKRPKLEGAAASILCDDDEPEIASLLVTSHSGRKGMEVRRVSDSKVMVHHSSRRGSCEGRGPGPCKRRRDTARHHDHHDGSRPGTPLVDERPENLIPSEPRRFRERSHEGPLSLPLPRFATQMLTNNNTSNSNNNNSGGSRSSHVTLSKIASPPCASSIPTTSPRTAPQPPASPPPRHPSPSPTSSDSETAPQSPSLEERIRSLDEKYEKWSGSRALSAAGGDALAKLDASASERFRFRHKLLDLDLHEVQPSDIVKSVLAKRSVFDEDSKRLENFSEKYEPREFTGVIGVSSMIGSTGSLAGVGCTSKVCLQYPFPSHPPVQTATSSSLSNLGATTSATSLTTTPTLKSDPRTVTPHNCVHPTTPVTPGTSIKTASPELPPVSLPISALGSATAASSSSSGSGLASASNLLSSNGSVGNLNSVHSLNASTSRAINPVVTCPVTTSLTMGTTTSTIISTATAATTTTTVAISTASTLASNASHHQPSTPSSTSLSTLSSSSSSSSSSEVPRAKLRKEVVNSSRESRDSRDSRDGKDSKHTKKETSRKAKKEDSEDKSRKEEKEERPNLVERVESEKENKETKFERKEREEKERREKEERDKQERREKEERDRQERKEREERERREKDEERRERERLEKERQEKERKEREERERKEREEVELRERREKERREREEKERQERKEREERERREREERERKERERLEREKLEKERLRKDREELERREREERERLEKEKRREEKERLEKERKREREEKERLERERRKEKEERERQEKEKRDKDEKEKLEREKRREREDQERREKEKVEREKRKEREEKEKEKEKRDREERRQPIENHIHQSVAPITVQTPAPVAIKRRCSSQDTPVEDDAKRMKISDHRRDSKDRSRQNRRSEDRKHRNDSHRSSRDSRDSRESKDSPGQENMDSVQTSCDLTRELSREGKENNREGGKEKQRKKSRSERSDKESRERSPRVSQEPDKDFLSRLELAKRSDPNILNDQGMIGSHHVKEMHHHHHHQNMHSDLDEGALSTHEMQGMRHPSATDTDSDEPKKHSIFDIVDDEPAYISMYDKVKARSTKNMQKLEEEKRQVRLKDKFSQLKQSRARREEKKQSTSWDGDSVSSKALTEDEATSESDSARAKSLSRKGSRSRIHSDTSEEDESFNNKRTIIKTERFHESDVDLGFADSEEKHSPLESTKTSVMVNNIRVTIKEEPKTSDDEERISFSANHPVANNHERDSRKKSHKKKQKRQKNSMSSEDGIKLEPSDSMEHKNIKINAIGVNLECRSSHSPESTNTITTKTLNSSIIDNAEERMRADKNKRNKKEKRRERNGEEKTKARRKRLNRQEARDSQRMEDIFGPLSDDIDETPTDTFFNRLGSIPNENHVYHSDSDGARSPDIERVRRKSEKKRRHQPQDENSVDLAEAGREIEAKLLGLPNSPKSAVCTESTDHDVFRFTDDNDSVEPSTPTTVPEKIKEKKKKRKKSKEERGRKDCHHHHHHHHHHHDKGGALPYLGAESSPPRASSPILSKEMSPTLPPSRESMPSPIPKISASIANVVTPSLPVNSNIQTKEFKPDKKKDKFIPGFGIEIDETLHENAVKSISEPSERESSNQPRINREEPEVPTPASPPSQAEDKPRVAISQEETEVAVAALMAENFGGPTEDYSYECEEEETEADSSNGPPPEAPQEDVEEMQQAVESLNASAGETEADLKPDTPQSEHDLQIDTDTEEDRNYESFDLSQPPKTPDIPSFYKAPAKTPTTLEKPQENRLPSSNISVVKPSSPLGLVISHPWAVNESKTREVAKVAPQVASQIEPLKPNLGASEPERPAQSLPQSLSQPLTQSLPQPLTQSLNQPLPQSLTQPLPQSLVQPLPQSLVQPLSTTTQPRRTSTSPSPPPQYKPSTPCGVPVLNQVPRIPAVSPRPTPIGYQPLHQRLPVSPQSQMVPLRQVAPRMQNVTPSSSANLAPLPPLVPSRMPPLISAQLSPRVSQPLSPNGQWSRNPVMTPHVPSGGKPSPPPVRIPVSVPISAHRPDTPMQHIYSTAASQQPVIQHAPGMRALAPNYPRGGLPPLTLNIPPRPYMPSVPPLTPGVQVKSSRDANLGGKSVIETLIPVNPNEPQRLEEPKLSPAVLPEPTNKASTSPKVPSPNQPPTYIPETAKIEISASTSSPVFGKPATTLDTMMLSPRQKQHTLDSNLLSPRQKQELSNLQLLTTHVPRSSTPSPVIVAHGQHLVHKSVVHPLGPPTVSSPNQTLMKTVVPIISQATEKCVGYDQKLGEQKFNQQKFCDQKFKEQKFIDQKYSEQKFIDQKYSEQKFDQKYSEQKFDQKYSEQKFDQKFPIQKQIPQGILLAKSPHIPLVSTQTIVSRVMTSVIPSLSKEVKDIKDMIEFPEFKEIKEVKDISEKILDGQTDSEEAQPMLLTPPVQPAQSIEVKEDLPSEGIKGEQVDKIKEEDREVKEDKIKVEKKDIEKQIELKEEPLMKEEPTEELKEDLKKENIKDHVPKEHVIKENLTKEHVTKEQVTKEHVTKEQVTKEHVTKEHVTKEHVTKEHVTKEYVTKEHVTREHVTKEHVIKELPKDLPKEDIKQELEADESTEDPLTEPSTDPLALDIAKEDPTDSKEDSDYWSAKEVNIESVIKKVDALCDGEENEVDEEAENQDTHDPHETSKSEGDSWLDSESMEGDSKKSFSNDDQDEGVETCEIETKSRRGRSKGRRGRGGVTTRRGAKTASVGSKRGGRSARGGKHYTEKNKPADVYEFHDDSEEDNAGRPRLILTIKSPGPNATGPNAQPATPVAAVKEVPAEEFVSPAINTRKSRRLAEKDGSRTTVDDIIEDVVRGTANKGLAATRRSTRHNNLPKGLQNQLVPSSEPRKSTRGGRKGLRRTSENNDDAEEKAKDLAPRVEKEEAVVERPEEIKVKVEDKKANPPTVMQKPTSLEPMTLIDPVTGMLIPMRESEEGQYIPVSTSGQVLQNASKVTVESRIGATCVISSSSAASAELARPVAESTPVKKEHLVEVKQEIKQELKREASPKSQSLFPPTPVQATVITKPHSPVTQVPTSVVIPTPTVAVSTIISTTTSVVTTQSLLTCSSQMKPHSLKAHVLSASKLVNPVQPLQHPIVVTKAAVPSLPNQAIVQNIVKQPVQAVQGLHLQIPSNRVVSPSLSPHAKHIQPANGKQGQPMSPVLNNVVVPPNPKQHLLQAAKQQAPTIINLPQKLPTNVHPGTMAATPTQRIHQGIPQPTALKGINGQLHPLNPKAHLLQAVVPPMMTGAVASPPAQPHLIGPQPVVTGATCSRSASSKAQVTGSMDPPKVEISMSGCIMVPSPGPQPRGVPISAYEASLHGSAGAAPSPGGQYGLVPPHRSQSPPLPPPAHHHANSSQGDVVNHFGSLSRGGELPSHYMHPYQLQYLRAQQEALTAPRIAYHVPGTRSPHLPLDPKLEAGGEESHSPPLELRRSTRTPQERTTDSPQVAQVYMLHGNARLPPPPQYNAGSAVQRGYYDPPPAHIRSQYPMAASEAPTDRAITPDRSRKHQVATPPHAAQVPPQADSLLMLLQRYPVMWQGLLALKNDQAAVQMHFVFGNPNVARDSLPCNSDGSTPPLRIAQRMRLEQTQVEGVARKMQMDNEHCMLLALPCGRDHLDVLQQSKNLQTGFITYLQQKQAAGIVNIAAPGSQQPAYVVHIFPSCDFANENLARIAPDLLHRVAEIAHLLIVIATV